MHQTYHGNSNCSITYAKLNNIRTLNTIKALITNIPSRIAPVMLIPPHLRRRLRPCHKTRSSVVRYGAIAFVLPSNTVASC